MLHDASPDQIEAPGAGEQAGDVAVAFNLAMPPRPARFRVLTPDDCTKENPRVYLVKGLVGRRDLVVVVGQPGAGKSVLVPYLGWRVAQGRRFFGRRVRQCPVLYIAAEDATGMQMRVAALRQMHGDAPDFFLVPDAPNLNAKDQRDITELAAIARDRGVGLIVVDTLARAFPGLRENEAEEMDHVVESCRLLAKTTDAAVVLVHHPAKAQGSETARGHGRLDGDADATLFVQAGQEGERGVKMGKNRNGSSDVKMTFRIQPVHLGEDEDGDPVTAPVAEELGGGTERAARLPSQAKRALDMLNTMVIVEGHALPPGTLFPQGVRGVPEKRWREECASRKLSPTDTEDAQRKAFDRAFKVLLERGKVAAREGWVWAV